MQILDQFLLQICYFELIFASYGRCLASLRKFPQTQQTPGTQKTALDLPRAEILGVREHRGKVLLGLVRVKPCAVFYGSG
ncbi:hypothetical protein N24_2665 [Corynebacterium suranareeae]|uniref:Uncharacterized protein n=1 Tax=Corynebacterium suranareeae TaxID=2506452 RepID=A0A160PRR8_9CORY|nr:hypothetical protein N24_2665 [Corynebacterium suranareeae]